MQMSQAWMYAEENKRNGFMCCPCSIYRNEKDYPSSKTLHIHLFRFGFMSGYNCWTKHEERGVMMEDNDEEEMMTTILSSLKPLIPQWKIMKKKKVKTVIRCAR
jgi:hypothetical protein